MIRSPVVGRPGQIADQIAAIQSLAVLRRKLPLVMHQKLIQVIGKIGAGRHGQRQRAPKPPVHLDESPVAAFWIDEKLDHHHAGELERFDQLRCRFQEIGSQRSALAITAGPAARRLMHALVLEGDQESRPCSANSSTPTPTPTKHSWAKIAPPLGVSPSIRAASISNSFAPYAFATSRRRLEVFRAIRRQWLQDDRPAEFVRHKPATGQAVGNSRPRHPEPERFRERRAFPLVEADLECAIVEQINAPGAEQLRPMFLKRPKTLFVRRQDKLELFCAPSARSVAASSRHQRSAAAVHGIASNNAISTPGCPPGSRRRGLRCRGGPANE